MLTFAQLKENLFKEIVRLENWDVMPEEDKQAYRELCEIISEWGNTEEDQTIQAYKWFLGAVQEAVMAEETANATAIVFLKGGKEATMKCSEVHQFMIDHADEIEPRHVKPLRPRQPRRYAPDPSDFTDFDDFNKSVEQGTLNDQFSPEFIAYTNAVAEKLSSYPKQLSAEELDNLRKALASYRD